MLQCYNKGCGQLFDPEKNNDESCRHHPGAPFFHDAYKGWSCCHKKSIDFTEFLNIKGCTLAQHSNVKPPEPEKPPQNDEETDKEEVITVRAPIRESLPRPPVDTPLVAINATVAPTLKQDIDALKSNDKCVPVQENKNEGETAIGTSCKNNGCNYSYTNTSTDFGECVHHPGVPIFHEGMKYWSCCQKRTSDFAQFMAQKGCIYGQHKWTKEGETKEVVECRYDWHQTAKNVIVSIYAKKYHYALSQININPVRLQVVLVFPEKSNAKFELDVELRGIINVETASAQMLGTKVEVTLPKLEPGSWQKLHFPVTKLPSPQSATSREDTKATESEDEFFDLDDIETVTTHGVKLSELGSYNPNNLD